MKHDLDKKMEQEMEIVFTSGFLGALCYWGLFGVRWSTVTRKLCGDSIGEPFSFYSRFPCWISFSDRWDARG